MKKLSEYKGEIILLIMVIGFFALPWLPEILTILGIKNR